MIASETEADHDVDKQKVQPGMASVAEAFSEALSTLDDTHCFDEALLTLSQSGSWCDALFR